MDEADDPIEDSECDELASKNEDDGGERMM